MNRMKISSAFPVFSSFSFQHALTMMRYQKYLPSTVRVVSPVILSVCEPRFGHKALPLGKKLSRRDV